MTYADVQGAPHGGNVIMLYVQQAAKCGGTGTLGTIIPHKYIFVTVEVPNRNFTNQKDNRRILIVPHITFYFLLWVYYDIVPGFQRVTLIPMKNTMSKL